MKKYELIPNPASLMESMREIGYSTKSAIADLIDNSITANAKEINIRFSWNNSNPYLAVIDDGHGMDMDELLLAMKIGSVNPLDKRDPDDLGRFGLGLKTASLSQSRKFTVLTKKNKIYSIAQWDLDSDDIAENERWSINILDITEISDILSDFNKIYLNDLNDGTIVFWGNIDRIDVGDITANKESKFNGEMNDVRDHLELVFHRYLSAGLGKKRIKIKFNESDLVPFDPFFISKSKELSIEEISSNDSKISVQPYVLPHHSKVSKEEFEKYAGQKGYLHEQGFYIYRNRRLIIHANWFRLLRKTEMTKLIRVKVDIPNSLDHLWKIDVKKSNAMPPDGIRQILKKIIGKIEVAGIRVYRHRGKKLISNVDESAWNRITNERKIFYEINQDHFLFKKLIKNNESENVKTLFQFLKVLENSFPRDQYFDDIASKPEQTHFLEMNKDDIKILLLDYLRNRELTENLIHDIYKTDPFATNRELTKEVIESLKDE